MPTGYTAKLMEHGQTFPEFAMECARAFGALIDMCNEPTGTPIPEKFEPSSYYVSAIADAKAKLERLNAMSDEERITYGQQVRAKAIESYERYLAKEEAENARLEEMEAKVRRWAPPTDDHKGLRDFMLEQINISKNRGNFSQRRLAEAKSKTPVDYFSESVLAAEQSVQYSTEQQQKEAARATGRTEWVQKLRKSLAAA